MLGFEKKNINLIIVVFLYCPGNDYAWHIFHVTQNLK